VPNLVEIDFSIFQHGGRRHLGFIKFQTFNGRTAQDGRNASKRGRDMTIFWFFKMAAAVVLD